VNKWENITHRDETGRRIYGNISERGRSDDKSNAATI
jgi:hypothetical protein